MRTLIISLFSLVSACFAAVNQLNQNSEQISRSSTSASNRDLPSRSCSFETAQLSIISAKTHFSPKSSYSKQSDMTEYRRDLLLDRPVSFFLEEEAKKQQLKTKNPEGFTQVCEIS